MQAPPPAPAQPWTASVFADFGALLKELGVGEAVDVAGITVTDAATGAPCLASFAPIGPSGSAGYLCWQSRRTPSASCSSDRGLMGHD